MIVPSEPIIYRGSSGTAGVSPYSMLRASGAGLAFRSPIVSDDCANDLAPESDGPIDEERERLAAQAMMPTAAKLTRLANESPAPQEWWDEPLPF